MKLILLLACVSALAAQTRWKLDSGGGITWEVQRGAAHQDQIEMSGRKVSLILTYGVRENGSPVLTRQLVFPTLRTIPNDTHASLSYTFADDVAPRLFLAGRPIAAEVVSAVHIRGLVTIDSTPARGNGVTLRRTIFPSTTSPLALEKYTFTNGGTREAAVEVESTQKTVRTGAARGVTGEYVICSEVLDPGARTLKPGESATFTLAFTAREAAAPKPVMSFLSKLRLETPDPVLNTEFAFAKTRTTESIYETKGGLMHGPGGGAYYAAIWANDQAEYANPFFPYLGDDTANESAINAFRHFARYMNADYKPIPSSIIAEGTSFWNGAGDRGDMAMIAYGASRFALAYGDRTTAEELWKLISWCLEYCRRKVTADGVVASDSDELEGRFPAGKANLNTSALYFDALNSAVFLGRELHLPAAGLQQYARQAEAIHAAIERYFGAKIQGFDAYRYYDGNDVLRAWICTPLTVGIFDRKQGVIQALFSPTLWTEDGLASQAGSATFWDRATLYPNSGLILMLMGAGGQGPGLCGGSLGSPYRRQDRRRYRLRFFMKFRGRNAHPNRAGGRGTPMPPAPVFRPCLPAQNYRLSYFGAPGCISTALCTGFTVRSQA
ncbi:conserved exported hypothetical protein [Candidatus Sulfopaludibacter sp. SbA3]|nr:conserved exported hypothetical protein [Candidatus Sulfopaludibacter sp. SbA3]